jgi:hypothetical protein
VGKEVTAPTWLVREMTRCRFMSQAGMYGIGTYAGSGKNCVLGLHAADFGEPLGEDATAGVYLCYKACIMLCGLMNGSGRIRLMVRLVSYFSEFCAGK